MKIFIAAILMLAQFSLFARDASSFCSTISYDPYKMDCLKVFQKNAYIEFDAAKLCRTIDYDPYFIDCLKEVKNRHYPPTILDICGKVSYGPHKTACLKENGQEISSSPNDTLIIVRSLAERAKYQLERYDVTGALKTINRILQLLPEL